MFVWAPYQDRVAVRLQADGSITELTKDPTTGWHTGAVAGLRHGVDYELLTTSGEALPDPLGRWFPHGVFGVTRWWDPASFHWHDDSWAGRELAPDGCLYELHVGTFTPAGTLDSAIERLDYLADLGVTHIELMPVSVFDSDRGWGYEGVTMRAVHQGYGGPDALCRFVDAAHQRGLAVLLDVVFNHLGPAGNFWDRLGPFLTGQHRTPWGDAVNLDAPGSDQVRAILIDSAELWIRDFHLDGLRLDAIHALIDNRAITFIEELSTTFASLAPEVGRTVALTAESDQCDPRTITGLDRGGMGMDAMWNDDIHHVLHWLLTGEDSGYYVDYASAEALEHAITRGLWLDGRWSQFRGRTHGRPLDFLTAHDPFRLIVSLQTHDQVGNRAAGERLSQLVGVDRLAAGAALLLSLPYTPMLFMGEEWGASTPWQFFSSFTDPDLAQAVTAGRRREFADHGWPTDAIPDPQSVDTFLASKLDWSELADGAGQGGSAASDHAQLHRWYRGLLRLRRGPAGGGAAEPPAATLGGAQRGLAEDAVGCTVTTGDDGVVASVVLHRPGFITAVNLAATPVSIPLRPGSTSVSAVAAPSGTRWQVALAWPRPSAARVVREILHLEPGGSAVIQATNGADARRVHNASTQAPT